MANWTKRLADARKRGFFTTKDEDLASKWGTCAVGEQLGGNTGRVERKLYGRNTGDFWLEAPVAGMNRLERLGRNFSSYVSGISPTTELDIPFYRAIRYAERAHGGIVREATRITAQAEKD